MACPGRQFPTWAVRHPPNSKQATGCLNDQKVRFDIGDYPYDPSPSGVPEVFPAHANPPNPSTTWSRTSWLTARPVNATMPTPMPGQPTARADPHAANARTYVQVGGGRTPPSLTLTLSRNPPSPQDGPARTNWHSVHPELQPTPRHSKSLERWNRTPHREPISLRPSSTETTPLDRLAAAHAQRWEGGRERGTSSQHPRGRLLQPTRARRRFSLTFLPCPSCLIVFILPARLSGQIRKGGRREGICAPPAVVTLTQVGNAWDREDGFSQGLGLRELCFLRLWRFVSSTKFTAETTE